ncbi:MAG: LptF/LptG family permease [Muribaculaceae bacterium]|nr:LptF/LptG family permease [Muribaculaceae bacterium]
MAEETNNSKIRNIDSDCDEIILNEDFSETASDSTESIEASDANSDIAADEAIENFAAETDKHKKKKRKGFKLTNPLPIIDRYILGKFLGTYFLATLLLLLVIAMFDITEKLDAFLTAPLKETLFDYFASFLPYFANQLSPLFVFISVIFFTTKLADNSEIIAMLSSGITFNRLLRPYMIGAAIIATLTFCLSNYIIPPTNVNRIAYTNKYVRNKAVEYGTNIQLMVRPGEVAYFGRFDNTTKHGYRFSLDKFDGKSIVSRLTASSVEYDSTRQYHWTLKDYMIRDFNGMNEKIRRGTNLDSIIPIEPKDFLISANDQEMLTTPQLTEYIRKQKMRGVANIKKFEIEKEKRLAETAAAFILTLIGMSLSSKKVKGGMGLNIGIGLALSFSYILFSTITSSFAINGYTSPAVAMQIPNIIYLIIGLILYRRASKF